MPKLITQVEKWYDPGSKNLNEVPIRNVNGNQEKLNILDNRYTILLNNKFDGRKVKTY